MNNSAYLIQSDTITIIHNNKTYTVYKNNNTEFNQIIEFLEKGDYQSAIELTDLKELAKVFCNSVSSEHQLEIINDKIFYKGNEINNALTTRIIRMIREKRNAQPLINFLNNLLNNPSKRAVDETYTFLEANSLPITEDGCLLAYKRVTKDFKDCWTGEIDNSVGQIVQMERNAVDDDKEALCSYGLHFCSLNYLQSTGYGGSYNPIVILKINPADIVSIPAEYEKTKGRCCKYQVVGIHQQGTSEDTLSQYTIIDTDEFFGEFQINS